MTRSRRSSVPKVRVHVEGPPAFTKMTCGHVVVARTGEALRAAIDDHWQAAMRGRASCGGGHDTATDRLVADILAAPDPDAVD